MGFVHHCDDPTPTTDQLAVGNIFHLELLEGRRHVVLSDAIWRGGGCEMLSTYCVNPPGRYMGMCHRGRGCWRRAVSAPR